MKYSDASARDLHRTGDDLLARIDELTRDREMGDGDGWRPLLWACGKELDRLRKLNESFAERIAAASEVIARNAERRK